MTEAADVLHRGTQEIGLNLQPEQAEQFKTYSSMLISWNERVNLTAITEPKEIAVKHFIDSLSLFSLCSIDQGAKVIDIGTGAGFPGIPLKIFRPDISLILLNSLQKRTNFLQAVVRELLLSQVTVVHGRAEDKGQDAEYREQFDIVLSRAVAPLNILAELCLPFVRMGGRFLSMKGPDFKEELTQAQSAIAVLGGKVAASHTYFLPISGDSRGLIVINKVAKTPLKYPRRAGLPEKKPLR